VLLLIRMHATLYMTSVLHAVINDHTSKILVFIFFLLEVNSSALQALLAGIKKNRHTLKVK
jgi:hypothetical protein